MVERRRRRKIRRQNNHVRERKDMAEEDRRARLLRHRERVRARRERRAFEREHWYALWRMFHEAMQDDDRAQMLLNDAQSREWRERELMEIEDYLSRDLDAAIAQGRRREMRARAKALADKRAHLLREADQSKIEFNRRERDRPVDVFAEHFHTFRVGAQTLTDPQLLRSDLSALALEGRAHSL